MYEKLLLDWHRKQVRWILARLSYLFCDSSSEAISERLKSVAGKVRNFYAGKMMKRQSDCGRVRYYRQRANDETGEDGEKYWRADLHDSHDDITPRMQHVLDKHGSKLLHEPHTAAHLVESNAVCCQSSNTTTEYSELLHISVKKQDK